MSGKYNYSIVEIYNYPKYGYDDNTYGFCNNCNQLKLKKCFYKTYTKRGIKTKCIECLHIKVETYQAREEVKERRNTRNYCECGGTYKTRSITAHNKTFKHTNYMNLHNDLKI